MTTTRDALKEAKSRFEKTAALPYPQGFEIGSWWKGKQEETRRRIAGFRSSEEAVRYAQRGQQSGFDHRIFDPDAAAVVARFKARELERLFPGWSLKGSAFHESPFSNSLVEIEGVPCSSIFLSHVNYYLRAKESLSGARPERVLEIGGGYGALARVFKLADPETRYVIVDLAESLFYAHVFLALNFPEARIAYLEGPRGEDFDFLLVPVQACGALAGERFNVVINTGSLQEMPPATVAFWMDFLQAVIRPRIFYSFNYFLINKKAFREASHGESNDICPVLDPWWEVRHFQINPDVLTVDADGRNWLEVCVERRERTADAQVRARELFLRARGFPRASNYWFGDMWMAIWCDAREEYVREMLRGIEVFRDETRSAVPKNFQGTKSLSVKARVKNAIRKAFLKKPEPDLSLFSEIDFYRRLLPREGRS